MAVYAGMFKAHCFEYLDDVAGSRRSVVSTKRGRPIAKRIPIESDPPQSLFGCMKGTVIACADLLLAGEWTTGE